MMNQQSSGSFGDLRKDFTAFETSSLGRVFNNGEFASVVKRLTLNDHVNALLTFKKNKLNNTKRHIRMI